MEKGPDALSSEDRARLLGIDAVTWLGLDIGGANLKAADGLGFAVSRPFALWQRPDKLPEALGDLLAACPAADALAVTMTGELADCFASKAEGVAAILGAVRAVSGRRAVRVYLTDGRLASRDEAALRPLEAAASNWHALARFASRFASDARALLLDVGSTTTDVVPILDGEPATSCRTDPERLASGELVYSGVARSPVCAVVREVPWRGARCPVAQEVFATMQDAYLVTGDLPERPDDLHTADGRPATRHDAAARLARSICADRSMLDGRDLRAIARAAAEAQLRLVSAAVSRVAQRLEGQPRTVIVSGEGEFLARRALTRLSIQPEVVSLDARLGVAVSRAAPAHALAVLAREEGAVS